MAALRRFWSLMREPHYNVYFEPVEAAFPCSKAQADLAKKVREKLTREIE